MTALESWYQFTDDECRQLGIWQERFEREADERISLQVKRLEFAKWLVEHNILNEFNVIDTTEDA